jgi:tetratricopeptide (TPR) repeat protein
MINSQTLFDKIANSGDPFAAIDCLHNKISKEFVEDLNATSLQLAQERNCPDSLHINDWALHCLKYVDDPLLEAHTYFNRSQFEKNSGDSKRAAESYRKAMLLYEMHGLPEDILDCAAGLLTILEERNDKQEIAKVAQRALEKSGITKSGQLSGAVKDGLLQIGQILMVQGETKLAKICFDVILQLSQPLGDIESEAEACGNLAEIYREEDDLDNALAILRRALELDRLLNNVKLEIVDLTNIGNLLYKQGKLDEAAAYYSECISLREQENYPGGIENDLYNFYHICHYLGRRKEALELFNRYQQCLSSGTPSILAYYLVLDEKGTKTGGREMVSFPEAYMETEVYKK